MNDSSETTRSDIKPKGVPPLVLLGGFILAATGGSAYFVLPDEQPPTTISSTLVIPGGNGPAEPSDRTGESTKPVADNSEFPSDDEVEPVEKTDPETARLNKLILGEWRQSFYGERTLTVKADGAATMTILPSGVFALGFGSKIDLTMFWSVKDGHLDYGVSGGTPADKVKLAASTWGDHWVEKIIELNETKLDLLSVDGSSHSIWERVPTEGDARVE